MQRQGKVRRADHGHALIKRRNALMALHGGCLRVRRLRVDSMGHATIAVMRKHPERLVASGQSPDYRQSLRI